MLGIVVLFCIEAFLCTQLGMLGYFVFMWAACALLIYLWNAGTPFRKMFAVILMPAILLRFLLPRALRDAVNALPSEAVGSGVQHQPHAFSDHVPPFIRIIRSRDRRFSDTRQEPNG